MRLSSQTLAILNKSNASYRTYNQYESEDCRFMADLGHPMTSIYAPLLSLYNQQKFACNSGTRYLRYIDEKNHATINIPTLSLTFYPPLREPFLNLGQTYPAEHESWMTFIKAAAEDGWQNDVDPTLLSGTITIISSNQVALAEMRDTMTSLFPDISLRTDKNEISLHTPTRPKNLGQPYAEALAAFLDHAEKILPTGSLPRRLPSDDHVPELPIHEKIFTLAGGTDISQTNDRVLAPLIPLGDSPTTIAFRQKILDQTRDIIAQGYPKSKLADYMKLLA